MISAVSELASLIYVAPSWESAESEAMAFLDSPAAGGVPRYVLEQTVGDALLQRPDFLRGAPTEAEREAAARLLPMLQSNQYAGMEELERLIQAVEGEWPETRVREAASSALEADAAYESRVDRLRRTLREECGDCAETVLALRSEATEVVAARQQLSVWSQ